jgi:hypothetical protein
LPQRPRDIGDAAATFAQSSRNSTCPPIGGMA